MRRSFDGGGDAPTEAAAVAVPGNITAPRADVNAGLSNIPEEWKPAQPVPPGQFPGSPVLPTDDERCSAIMKCGFNKHAGSLFGLPNGIDTMADVVLSSR